MVVIGVWLISYFVIVAESVRCVAVIAYLHFNIRAIPFKRVQGGVTGKISDPPSLHTYFF